MAKNKSQNKKASDEKVIKKAEVVETDTERSRSADLKPEEKLADEYFGYYPKENVIYISTDMQPFFNKSDAANHQKSVDKSKELLTFKRK